MTCCLQTASAAQMAALLPAQPSLPVPLGLATAPSASVGEKDMKSPSPKHLISSRVKACLCRVPACCSPCREPSAAIAAYNDGRIITAANHVCICQCVAQRTLPPTKVPAKHQTASQRCSGAWRHCLLQPHRSGSWRSCKPSRRRPSAWSTGRATP